MMKFLIIIFFTLITEANLISVESSTDGYGMFTYLISSGVAPFYFGGNFDVLKVAIPSAGVLETHGPEGWYSEIDDNDTVTWLYTNSYIGFIDKSHLEFSIKSVYAQSTNYSDTTGTLWQKGYVAGDIYNTNYL